MAHPPETAPRIALVGGMRTPFVKAGTVFKGHRALDLALHATEGLVDRLQVDISGLGVVAYGIVVQDPRIPHLAREVVLRSVLPPSVRALTVSDNCITGLSAMGVVYDALRRGAAEAGLAGGVESMSNPPLAWRPEAARHLIDASQARTTVDRLRALTRLRPGDFWPQPPGVKEPSTGLSMGEHCELMVKAWGISRVEQDAIALRSHQRAHAATEDGRLTQEIIPLDGHTRDGLIRPGTSMAQLAALRPVFDPTPTGTITAGNASPLTDGAAGVLLMTEARARAEGREPLAFIRGFLFAGIDPDDGLLMAPALAVPRLLRQTGLTLDQMDLVEIHEAFAGQVACNLKAWAEGWKEPAIGTVDPERLNVLGGSLALGHPFAATGVRILTSLAYEMHRRDVRYGLVSVCGAGATAGAVILER